MIDTAKQYNDYGLAVLPVKADKSPASATWKDGIAPEQFKDAYGIGIVCGQKSGNLEVLDFDNHFGDAKKRIKDFSEQCEVVKKLVLVQTKSGGYHLIYRCPEIGGNKKLASKPRKKDNRFVPDAVIETRGEGGYIVGVPTPDYKLLKGSLSDIPKITVEQRCELMQVAKSFNEWVDIQREYVEQEERPGDKYNQTQGAIEDMKIELRQAGWVHIRNHLWRRPDKKDGISATVGKVAPNVFYVFSSNAYPFEDLKGYTPFQVVGLLRYGGDFKAFAEDLAKQYGTKNVKTETIKTQIDKTETLKNLEKAKIDLTKPVQKPPVAITVKEVDFHTVRETRLFTLGNFSAIIGKAKSKKTFFLNILSTVVINNRLFYDKFQLHLPENKKKLAFFDTEQGDYDVYNTAKRIAAMADSYKNFEMFQLREFEPLQRCQIIDEYLQSNTGVGMVVIDGLADLGVAVNDEEEATRVTSLLMRWTKQYGIHIVTVIHQNKMNEFATGHLGSYIMKKAEIVISVTKDNENKDKSIVSVDYSRGRDFEDFAFMINEKGLPELTDAPLKEDVSYEEAPF